jgi:ferric-dicitrate binding protein FerR (iron transport regulator)
MNSEQYHNAVYLLEKYLTGSLSADEQSALETWIQANPDNQSLFTRIHDGASLQQEVQRFYAVQNRMRAQLEQFIPALTTQPGQTVIPPVHRVHFLKTAWFRYAAILLLICGTALYLYRANIPQNQAAYQEATKGKPTDIRPGGDKAILTLSDGSTIVLGSTANGNVANQGSAKIIKLDSGTLAYRTDARSTDNEVLYNTITTPNGGQYQVTLPDGTRVWLNASSSITFPTAFVGSNRLVKITGEIYFEVATNKQKPLVVDVDGKSMVQVLGTNFNINSYGDDGNIKTTLLEGSVKVMRGTSTAADLSSGQQTKTPESVFLKPGQQAVQKNTTGIFVVNSPDIERTLAWKNGIFDFTGADFKSVMKQLERWYDIRVQYNGSVPKMTFDGKMYRNVNFSGVLEMLTTMDVKFRMEGKTLIVL